MSKLCNATKRIRTARVLCYCCNQSLCFQHLEIHKDHNNVLVEHNGFKGLPDSEFDLLLDQTNDILDRLKLTDVEIKTHNCRRKLE